MKEMQTDEESLAEELFQQVLEIFQLRSHEAAMVSVSLTDINNGDDLIRQTLQNVSHCFHQGGTLECVHPKNCLNCHFAICYNLYHWQQITQARIM